MRQCLGESLCCPLNASAESIFLLDVASGNFGHQLGGHKVQEEVESLCSTSVPTNLPVQREGRVLRVHEQMFIVVCVISAVNVALSGSRLC